MLDAPQEQVGPLQLFGFALFDPASTAEASQRAQGVGLADTRVLAAVDQLQALHEELCLADATHADLEISHDVPARLHAGPLEQLRQHGGYARVNRLSKYERREQLTHQ